MAEIKKMVPKRRFKGFTEDWEERELGEHTTFRRGSFPQPYGNKEWYDGEGAMPFIQVVDVTKQLNLVENTKQKISVKAQPNSVFIPKGSVIVTLQGSIGRVAITQYDAYMDRTLLLFESYRYRTEQRFWAYTIQRIFDIEKLRAPGGTIKTITKEALAKFEISLPNYKEQQKLGIFFQNLDSQITLQQRKLEKIKAMKKAYLSEMFPAAGQTKPKRRFKGFTEVWVEKKVQDFVDNEILATPMDGNHGEKHPTAKDYVLSGIPFVMARDLYDGQVDLKHCGFISVARSEKLDKGFAYNGDILLTHKATIGETAIIKGLKEKYAVLTPQVTYYRILDFEKLSRDYLYAYFNSDEFQNELKTEAIQSTRAYIGITDQRKLSIKFPANIEEQRAIGNFFSDLDKQISLHQKKLSKLQKLKKAYLNEMFI